MNLLRKFFVLFFVAILAGCAGGEMDKELQNAINTFDISKASQLLHETPDRLSGVVVSDVSMQGVVLHDISFHDVTFSNVDFAEAQFSNVMFKNCTFEAVSFENSVFHNVRFLGSILRPLGTTPQDEVLTHFKGAQLDRVGFGEKSKLLDVNMDSLQKGSSVTIVDSVIEPVVEGNTWMFNKSYLDKLVIDRTTVGKDFVLGMSILGGGEIIIRNSEIQESDLHLEDTKKIVLEGNKDSILRIVGNVESVVVTKNERSSFGIDGVVNTVRATNNFGKTSGIGFGGKINEIEVTDCSDLVVVFS